MQITRPVFIIGSYRGGTSLLLRLLSESEELWSLYRESNHLWQNYHRNKEESSDTVILEKQTDGTFKNLLDNKIYSEPQKARKAFDKHYHYSSYDNYALGYLGRVRTLRDKLRPLFDSINIFNYLYKLLKINTRTYRIVDKTPPNIYRIEYLKALYPDAKFIYLVRDKEANVKSLISAWTHPKKFVYAYRKYLTEDLDINIAGYSGKVWKFYIPRDFQNYLDKSIREICEHQYDDAHHHAKQAFKNLETNDFLEIKFEDFMQSPDQIMQKICDFTEIKYSTKMKSIVKAMPVVNSDLKNNKMQSYA